MQESSPCLETPGALRSGVGWGRGSPGSPGASSQGEGSLEPPLVAAVRNLKLWGIEAALTEI